MSKFFRLMVFGLIFGTTILPIISQARVANLRVNPLLIMMGALHADFDFKLGSGFTLGPSFHYMDDSDSMDMLSYGLRANYYLSGTAFSQGWLLGSFIHYMDVKHDDNGFAIGALGDHQWFWNRFNITLGAGLVYHLNGSNVSMMNHHRGNSIAPHFEANLGWLF